MENDATVGWIAAIVIGGIAGWLAEQFMKSNAGMLMNIALGIVGAIVANAILSVVGINLGGWLGYLIAGFLAPASSSQSGECSGAQPEIDLPKGIEVQRRG